MPFHIYADGIDLVVFEEFGAGRAALHLANELERNALMKDEAYRRWFRRDYEKKFTPRVWHRDFFDAHIDACPEADLVGKTFGEVAATRGLHPVDLFLDLVVLHGKKLRWHTLIANYRPKEIAWMIQQPCALIGFADSGAHIRNMAFYSAPLRMLRMVRDAERAGTPIMPMERAVHRLTGETRAPCGWAIARTWSSSIRRPSTRGSTPTTRRKWKASAIFSAWSTAATAP